MTNEALTNETNVTTVRQMKRTELKWLRHKNALKRAEKRSGRCWRKTNYCGIDHWAWVLFSGFLIPDPIIIFKAATAQKDAGGTQPIMSSSLQTRTCFPYGWAGLSTFW